MPYLVISENEFQSLSTQAKRELMSRFTDADAPKVKPSPEMPAVALSDDESFAELTVPLARKLVAGLSEKTKELLVLMVRQGGRCSLSDIVRELDLNRWQDSRGMLAGITKRVRTILNSDEAYLLAWDESTNRDDENGKLIDGDFHLHPTTLKSLAIVLSVEPRQMGIKLR